MPRTRAPKPPAGAAQPNPPSPPSPPPAPPSPPAPHPKKKEITDATEELFAMARRLAGAHRTREPRSVSKPGAVIPRRADLARAKGKILALLD